MGAPDLLAVPVAGGDLRVARWPGDGPVVMAAHGITGNHLWWAETAAALGGVASVLAPDLRGRAGSMGLPGPYGLSAHVADLVAVLDHARVDRAVVVGHSMGAWVTARLATGYPERVQRLVLVDGGVPLPLPAGGSPASELPRLIPLSWERLGKAFAGPGDYAAFWRRDPATDAVWSDSVQAALVEDLREGPDGAWRAAVLREAVVADWVELFDPAGRSMLAHAATYLVPATGGLHDPGEVRATVPPPVRIEVVEGVDHDTLVLTPRGAARVAGAVRD